MHGIEAGSRAETAEAAETGWERLGAVAPDALAGARVALHWGAQVVAAAGETYLEHTPDTAHTSMEWLRSERALAGPAHPSWGFRVALHPAGLSLLLLDPSAHPAARLSLAGRTLAEAYAWTSQAMASHTGGALRRALVHPGYEMPAHPIGAGAAFEAPEAGALAELERWYANADLALREQTAGAAASPPVRCWPHHFDIAALFELAHDAEGVATRTVGVGMTPGDDDYGAPYWYVNGWPVGDEPALPPLPVGHWHTEGWLGAILEAPELVGAGAAAAQHRHLRAFLVPAIAAARALVV